MKSSLENNDLIYIPNDLKGEFLFEGIPCPTIEVHDLIGDRGVETIHQRLAQMLEWRKTMFGERNKEDYGFRPMEKFIEVKSEIILAVGGVIQDTKEINIQENNKNNKNNKVDTFPEYVVSKEYRENNYKKLLNQDHYLIEIYEQHIPRLEGVDIAEYYRKHYLI